jgi:hypothetical protein
MVDAGTKCVRFFIAFFTWFLKIAYKNLLIRLDAFAAPPRLYPVLFGFAVFLLAMFLQAR